MLRLPQGLFGWGVDRRQGWGVQLLLALGARRSGHVHAQSPLHLAVQTEPLLHLGEVRVGVEPALVADLVVTLGAGVEVWLAGGRREVRGLTYRTQRAAGKGSDLGDGVG